MNQKEIIRKVKWKDLVRLNSKEMIIENTITLPWLIVSLFLSWKEYYIAAIPFSVMYFLTALRQVHNGFHNSLGTNKTLTWLSLYLNSLGMVASIHAVKFSHLRHHKYFMNDEDHEGACAKLKWWQAILYGPVHIYTIHKIIFSKANKFYKKQVLLEMFSIAAFMFIAVYFNIHFLIYHIIVMLAGEMFSAFFAVWSVHHDCDEHTIARTQRTGWKNFITYNMFYHLEHHLFPAVPTIKLPILAKRIDEYVPELNKKSTF